MNTWSSAGGGVCGIFGTFRKHDRSGGSESPSTVVTVLVYGSVNKRLILLPQAPDVIEPVTTMVD